MKRVSTRHGDGHCRRRRRRFAEPFGGHRLCLSPVPNCASSDLFLSSHQGTTEIFIGWKAATCENYSSSGEDSLRFPVALDNGTSHATIRRLQMLDIGG